MTVSRRRHTRAGGFFRLADFNGLGIEKIYLEVGPDRVVVFSWGGIKGLRPGQSTVFAVYADSQRTLIRVRLPLSLILRSMRTVLAGRLGLPKLTAVAEGAVVETTCLDEVADFVPSPRLLYRRSICLLCVARDH
jgi:hypothetical protein